MQNAPEADAGSVAGMGDEPGGERRRLDAAELEQTIAQHLRWLESDGRAGVQADLRRTDLAHAGLDGANLRKAKLCGAVLDDARLVGAVLDAADLERAALRRAELAHTTFHHANLIDADLSAAKGLTTGQLAGAIVTRAALPPEIADFGALRQVEEISKLARNVFLAVIGGCVYCWLTLATTADADLLNNAASTPLPIIQTQVPIAGFYLAAPVILLALYLYLHLHLQTMWEGLAELPAVLQDGRTLERHAYPWLLTGLVSVFVPRLRDRRPSFWVLRALLSIVLAWLLVPLTIASFWLRYLPTHDPLGTLVLVGLVLIATWVGTAYFWHARDQLSDRRGRKGMSRLVYGLEAAPALVMAGVSLAAVHGDTPFRLAGYRTFADLREAELSARPEAWFREQDRSLVRGADLRHANLRHAVATRAFAINADFRGVDLSSANFSGAELAGANFEGATLTGVLFPDADLSGARLSNLDLSTVELRGARLDDAVLERVTFSRGVILAGQQLNRISGMNARLEQANLAGAELTSAELHGAELAGANLQESDLSRADLTSADLRGARVQGARLVGALIEHTDLSSAQIDCGPLRRGGPLVCVDLTGANLAGAKLLEADLSGAVLKRAILIEADLSKAILGCAAYQRARQCANLEDAELEQAKLSGVDARAANFQGVSLVRADLKRAALGDSNLTSADLQGAVLEEADLTGASLRDARLDCVRDDQLVHCARLRWANLQGTDLSGTRLRGADLSDTKNLTQAQLDAACGDERTKLPPELRIAPCPAADPD
jgi:uncharacterized protein YjbI with pentapeptide repeats